MFFNYFNNQTSKAGDWIFEVDGFGIDPAKEWKETIKFKTEPFSSAKQMLTIFNSSPVTVNATVSLEASPKNAGFFDLRGA